MVPDDPHGHVEPGPADLPHGGRQRGADAPAARLDGLGGRLGRVEVAPGQPDAAELEAAGGQDLALGAHHQLGGPAADVAHHDLAVEHRHRLQHAQVDEPGLLEPGDHLDLDADRPGPLDEHGAVLGLPHGGGGHGPHGRPLDGGHLLEAVERLDAAVDGGRREPLHVAGRGPQPDHLALAVEDLDAVRVHPGHHQVDRVRADVDGGQDVRHLSTLSHKSGHGDDSYPVRRRV